MSITKSNKTVQRLAKTIVCPWCKESFRPYTKHQVCCNRSHGLLWRHSKVPKIIIMCLQCGKQIQVIKARFGKAKYCSHSCAMSYKLQHSLIKPNVISKKENPAYKRVPKYQALHRYIRDHWGKANTCDFCQGIKSKYFDWANKTGNYDKYDRSDWLQLCKKCHFEYDKVQHV